MPNRNVKLLFALFALSGFTGLIYESVWSHYLKLFLGAAAFAQSFVLAAFMGGMALGAWLASRWSTRLGNLLSTYAWVEAAIGLAALVFHEIYVALTQASLEHIIPALATPLAVELYKYALCTVLIVPQTVLLGMTFPLMSGAVIRRGPEASGHHLAMLYFTNSIGAAIGALAAAFWLLGWLGMPGTMRAAGLANLALAAAVFAIAQRGEPAPLASAPSSGAAPAGRYIVRLLLAAAFVTGLASFVYEIVWIRMLSLVLGSCFRLSSPGLLWVDCGYAAVSMPSPIRCASPAWCRFSWASPRSPQYSSTTGPSTGWHGRSACCSTATAPTRCSRCSATRSPLP
jgi:MFS family permease